MSIIVQKFGGTSVADSQKILAAARKAIRAKMEGHQVVTVVSAMGHTTDHLIDLAKQITTQPPAREMDMLLATGEQISIALLCMAIKDLDVEAISLTDHDCMEGVAEFLGAALGFNLLFGVPLWLAGRTFRLKDF